MGRIYILSLLTMGPGYVLGILHTFIYLIFTEKSQIVASQCVMLGKLLTIFTCISIAFQ